MFNYTNTGNQNILKSDSFEILTPEVRISLLSNLISDSTPSRDRLVSAEGAVSQRRDHCIWYVKGKRIISLPDLGHTMLNFVNNHKSLPYSPRN